MTTLDSLIFCAYGIVEQKTVFGFRRHGRKSLQFGQNSIIHEPLVQREKIVFPPLHIKLSLMKQFVNALSTKSDCFKYLCNAFPGITIEKLKAGIFDGPQIRKLMNGRDFIKSMHDLEKNLWEAFVYVVRQTSMETKN